LIEIERIPSGGAKVRISSSRRLDACRLLIGRPALEAPRLASVIFGVCGMAQGAASVSAIEDALGCEAAEEVRLAREVIVMAETVREHVLRVVLDWSRWLGEAPEADQAALAGLKDVAGAPGRLCAALFGGASPFEMGAKLEPTWPVIACIVDDMESVVRRVVFGVSPTAWSSECSGSAGEGLECWAACGTTVAARMVAEVAVRDWLSIGHVEPHFLPGLEREALLTRLLSSEAPSFVAAPEWNNAPCETGALAREYAGGLVNSVVGCWGAGLLARLIARLAETARSVAGIRGKLERIKALSFPLGVGARNPSEVAMYDGDARLGAAQVQAARGLLVHAVELHGGRVRRYWIVAPTEWNFHPKGVASQALTGLYAANEAELRRQAELVVYAIDPCVACDLRVV
jgi:uptake hydrogenase large subunit